MRCNHCQSLMFEADTVKEGCTEQTWYECPTCGRTHLYSRCVPGQNAAKIDRRPGHAGAKSHVLRF